eukprot:CAMPEP_0116139368 /NCGR_PEP_ID=MMETSP0329-20121206/13278_1 /TAXON_ID=697910 /ORGANISM="Pseudo-nitzschia arenysensis, Strain B593" /LENGTH=330 /DNA_ID=CAMNT_0003634413 /DNA_START=245 /DNA_END=1233 /DNA_ORIENTATION=+
MLKASPSTRALPRAQQASREDVTIEDSSPRARKTKARQALGDVSNNKARSALDGNRNSVMSDNIEKRSSQRLRISSTVGSANEDRNLSNDETKRPPLSGKGGLDSQKIEIKPDHGDKSVPSTDERATKNGKPTSDKPCKPEEKGNRNTQRPKKRVNGGRFDIESALLEPRPKRNRQKATKRATVSEKKDTNNTEEGEKSAETHETKVKTPDAVSSELPSSTKTLIPSSPRRLDPAEQSDDDYCLPRKFEGPFDASKFTTGIATYDKASKGNVGEVPAYVTDIFQRLFDAERITKASPSYMTDEQDEINSTMRAILVGWLVGVQENFRLQP